MLIIVMIKNMYKAGEMDKNMEATSNKCLKLFNQANERLIRPSSSCSRGCWPPLKHRLANRKEMHQAMISSSRRYIQHPHWHKTSSKWYMVESRDEESTICTLGEPYREQNWRWWFQYQSSFQVLGKVAIGSISKKPFSHCTSLDSMDSMLGPC